MNTSRAPFSIDPAAALAQWRDEVARLYGSAEPMDLQGVIGGTVRGFRCKQLGHRRRFRQSGVAGIGCAHGGCAEGEQACGIELGGHISDHPLNGFELGDRPSELLAIFGFGDAVRKASLADAHRLRGDVDAPAFDDVACDRSSGTSDTSSTASSGTGSSGSSTGSTRK